MSLPPAVQSVLELFQGPLCNIRFADVDAAGLAHLAAEVEAATAEVEAREAALVELRHSLAQRQEALQSLAHQALAYARVYAENNDESLLDVIAGINLPRAAGSPKAAKGRKPNKAGPKDVTAERDAADRDAAERDAAERDAERDVAAEQVAHEVEPEAAGGHTGENASAELEGVDAPSEAPARGARKGRPRATHAAVS